jgi:hypothetical protein
VFAKGFMMVDCVVAWCRRGEVSFDQHIYRCVVSRGARRVAVRT